MEVIKIIEEYRRINNLTQTELAKKLGISKSFLCELEHRHSKPSPETLVHLSNTLKICPIRLLNFFSNDKLEFNCCADYFEKINKCSNNKLK